MIQYQIRATDSYGNTLAFLKDFKSCSYTIRGDGGVGVLQLTVPQKYRSIFNSDNPDYRISVWRSINGSSFKLDGRTEFLALKWETNNTDIIVTAQSIQHILTRRINAYQSGLDLYTVFTSLPAGDIMKALVRNNFTTGIDASRDGSEVYADISSYLSVGADAGDGSTLTIECSRKNVHDTIMELAASSWEAGTWLAGIITSDGNSWTFNTYQDYFGVDRSYLAFSPSIGNVQNIVVGFDLTDEKNWGIAGGRGQGATRVMSSAGATGRAGASPIARKELFTQNTQAVSIAQLTHLASSEIRQLRGVRQFQCELVQVPSYLRGVDYNVGDYLTVLFNGLRYTMRLDVVEVSITPGQLTERALLRL